MEKEIEIVQKEDVVVENVKEEKIVRKGLILRIAIPLLVAVLSFAVFGSRFSSPEAYKDVIETLDNKRNVVIGLSASTATLATTASLILGDRATAISNKLLDLTGYFLIILCAILLEKYLAVIMGILAFRIIIPISCLLFIISELRRDKIIRQFSIKLVIFALSAFLLTPASVAVSDLVENTYKESIQSTINNVENTTKEIEALQEADEVSEKEKIKAEEEKIEKQRKIEEERLKVEQEEKNILGKIGSGVKNFFGGVKEKATEVGGAIVNTAGGVVTTVVSKVAEEGGKMIKKATDLLGSAIEAIAVMLMVTCVIPIVIILIYIWLIKMLFSVDFQISYEKIPKLSKIIKNKKGLITEK